MPVGDKDCVDLKLSIVRSMIGWHYVSGYWTACSFKLDVSLGADDLWVFTPLPSLPIVMHAMHSLSASGLTAKGLVSPGKDMRL
jgi:hypothetical protein